MTRTCAAGVVEEGLAEGCGGDGEGGEGAGAAAPTGTQWGESGALERTA